MKKIIKLLTYLCLCALLSVSLFACSKPTQITREDAMKLFTTAQEKVQEDMALSLTKGNIGIEFAAKLAIDSEVSGKNSAEVGLKANANILNLNGSEMLFNAKLIEAAEGKGTSSISAYYKDSFAYVSVPTDGGANLKTKLPLSITDLIAMIGGQPQLPELFEITETETPDPQEIIQRLLELNTVVQSEEFIEYTEGAISPIELFANYSIAKSGEKTTLTAKTDTAKIKSGINKIVSEINILLDKVKADAKADNAALKKIVELNARAMNPTADDAAIAALVERQMDRFAADIDGEIDTMKNAIANGVAETNKQIPQDIAISYSVTFENQRITNVKVDFSFTLKTLDASTGNEISSKEKGSIELSYKIADRVTITPPSDLNTYQTVE